MKDYTNVSDISKPETTDVEKSLGPVGQRAMQGSDLSLLVEPMVSPDTSLPNLGPSTATTEVGDAMRPVINGQIPPIHNPPTATTELGYAMRVETAVEKSEVKHFHDIAPEGIYSGGRGSRS